MNSSGLPNLRKKHPFKFSWVNYSVLGLALLYVVITHLKNLKEPDGLVVMIANGALYVLFSLLAAIVVWVIRKKREWAGTYTLNAVVLAIFIIHVMVRKIALAPDMEGVIERRTVLKKAIEVNSATAEIAYTDYIDFYVTQLEKGKEYYSTSESMACARMLAFAERNLAIKKNWEHVYEQVISNNLFHEETFYNQEELMQSRELMEDYAAVSENYLRFYAIEVQEAIDALEKMDSESDVIQSFIEELKYYRKKRENHFTKVLNAHQQYAQAASQLFNLILQKQNDFHVDASGNLLFKNEKLHQQYQTLDQQIRTNSTIINTHSIWYLTFF